MSDKTNKLIDARMNRLVGQIESTRRMIHSGRKTEAIVQQILAARQALSKIALIMLKEELVKQSECRGLPKNIQSRRKKHIEHLLEKTLKV